MSLLIRKFYHLILNRRTITRTCSLNNSRKKRRPFQILSNNLMGFGICISQPTGDLFLLDRLRICRKRKRNHLFISKLLFHLRKINTSLIYPCWSSCLKTEHFNPIGNQRIRQMSSCLKSIGTGWIAHIPINTSCPQISSSCQNYSLSMIKSSGNGFHTLNFPLLHYNF